MIKTFFTIFRKNLFISLHKQNSIYITKMYVDFKVQILLFWEIGRMCSAYYMQVIQSMSKKLIS